MGLPSERLTLVTRFEVYSLSRAFGCLAAMFSGWGFHLVQDFGAPHFRTLPPDRGFPTGRLGSFRVGSALMVPGYAVFQPSIRPIIVLDGHYASLIDFIAHGPPVGGLRTFSVLYCLHCHGFHGHVPRGCSRLLVTHLCRHRPNFAPAVGFAITQAFSLMVHNRTFSH